jgi:hypothetical protein
VKSSKCCFQKIIKRMQLGDTLHCKRSGYLQAREYYNVSFQLGFVVPQQKDERHPGS